MGQRRRSKDSLEEAEPLIDDLDDRGSQQSLEENIVPWAQQLGMDLLDPDDKDLMWIAKDFQDCEIPDGWEVHADAKKRVFYYNRRSHVTQWEHPRLQEYKDYLEQYRTYVAQKREQEERKKAEEVMRQDEERRRIQAKHEEEMRKQFEIEAAARRMVAQRDGAVYGYGAPLSVPPAFGDPFLSAGGVYADGGFGALPYDSTRRDSLSSVNSSYNNNSYSYSNSNSYGASGGAWRGPEGRHASIQSTDSVLPVQIPTVFSGAGPSSSSRSQEESYLGREGDREQLQLQLQQQQQYWPRDAVYGPSGAAFPVAPPPFQQPLAFSRGEAAFRGLVAAKSAAKRWSSRMAERRPTRRHRQSAGGQNDPPQHSSSSSSGAQQQQQLSSRDRRRSTLSSNLGEESFMEEVEEVEYVSASDFSEEMYETEEEEVEELTEEDDTMSVTSSRSTGAVNTVMQKIVRLQSFARMVVVRARVNKERERRGKKPLYGTVTSREILRRHEREEREKAPKQSVQQFATVVRKKSEVQRRYEEQLARKELRREHLQKLYPNLTDELVAALELSSRIKRLIAFVEWWTLNEAAQQIQSIFRGGRVRGQIQRKVGDWAATTIQRIWKGNNTRRRSSLRLQKKRENDRRNNAAKTLQRFGRVLLAKFFVFAEGQAVGIIENAMEAYKQRREARKAMDSLKRATVVLQSSFRRSISMKRFEVFKQKVDRIERFRRELLALKITLFFRGIAAKKRLCSFMKRRIARRQFCRLRRTAVALGLLFGKKLPMMTARSIWQKERHSALELSRVARRSAVIDELDRCAGASTLLAAHCIALLVREGLLVSPEEGDELWGQGPSPDPDSGGDKDLSLRENFRNGSEGSPIFAEIERAANDELPALPHFRQKRPLSALPQSATSLASIDRIKVLHPPSTRPASARFDGGGGGRGGGHVPWSGFWGLPRSARLSFGSDGDSMERARSNMREPDWRRQFGGHRSTELLLPRTSLNNGPTVDAVRTRPASAHPHSAVSDIPSRSSSASRSSVLRALRRSGDSRRGLLLLLARARALLAMRLFLAQRASGRRITAFALSFQQRKQAKAAMKREGEAAFTIQCFQRRMARRFGEYYRAMTALRSALSHWILRWGPTKSLKIKRTNGHILTAVARRTVQRLRTPYSSELLDASRMFPKVCRRALSRQSFVRVHLAAASVLSLLQREFAQKQYRRETASTLQLSSFFRRLIAREREANDRRKAHAYRLGCAALRLLKRTEFVRFHAAAIKVQALQRGIKTRTQAKLARAKKVVSARRFLNRFQKGQRLKEKARNTLSAFFLAQIMRNREIIAFESAKQAVVLLQSVSRMSATQNWYQRQRRASCRISALGRGFFGRKTASEIRSARLLQSASRRCLRRRQYVSERVAVSLLSQSCRRANVSAIYREGLRERAFAKAKQLSLFARSALLSRSFREKKTSGLKIEKSLLSLLLRREWSAKRDLWMRGSATVLSSAGRRLISLRRMKAASSASSSLSSLSRCCLKQMTFRRKKQASTALLSVFRRRLARDETKKNIYRTQCWIQLVFSVKRALSRSAFMEKAFAAVFLSACVKRRAARQLLQKRSAAATVLAAAGRRAWLVRLVPLAIAVEKDAKAVLVRVFRSFAFRRKLHRRMSAKFLAPLFKAVLTRAKTARLFAATVKIHGIARRFLFRRLTERLQKLAREAIIKVQTAVRGWLARRRLAYWKKKLLAGRVLLARIPSALSRCAWLRKRRGVALFQACWRGFVVRRLVCFILVDVRMKAAIAIQKCVRGFLLRSRVRRDLDRSRGLVEKFRALLKQSKGRSAAKKEKDEGALSPLSSARIRSTSPLSPATQRKLARAESARSTRPKRRKTTSISPENADAFTPDELLLWRRFFDYTRSNHEELERLAQMESRYLEYMRAKETETLFTDKILEMEERKVTIHKNAFVHQLPRSLRNKVLKVAFFDDKSAQTPAGALSRPSSSFAPSPFSKPANAVSSEERPPSIAADSRRTSSVCRREKGDEGFAVFFDSGGSAVRRPFSASTKKDREGQTSSISRNRRGKRGETERTDKEREMEEDELDGVAMHSRRFSEEIRNGRGFATIKEAAAEEHCEGHSPEKNGSIVRATVLPPKPPSFRRPQTAAASRPRPRKSADPRRRIRSPLNWSTDGSDTETSTTTKEQVPVAERRAAPPPRADSSADSRAIKVNRPKTAPSKRCSSPYLAVSTIPDSEIAKENWKNEQPSSLRPSSLEKRERREKRKKRSSDGRTGSGIGTKRLEEGRPRSRKAGAKKKKSKKKLERKGEDEEEEWLQPASPSGRYGRSSQAVSPSKARVYMIMKEEENGVVLVQDMSGRKGDREVSRGAPKAREGGTPPRLRCFSSLDSDRQPVDTWLNPKSQAKRGASATVRSPSASRPPSGRRFSVDHSSPPFSRTLLFSDENKTAEFQTALTKGAEAAIVPRLPQVPELQPADDDRTSFGAAEEEREQETKMIETEQRPTEETGEAVGRNEEKRKSRSIVTSSNSNSPSPTPIPLSRAFRRQSPTLRSVAFPGALERFAALQIQRSRAIAHPSRPPAAPVRPASANLPRRPQHALWGGQTEAATAALLKEIDARNGAIGREVFSHIDGAEIRNSQYHLYASAADGGVDLDAAARPRTVVGAKRPLSAAPVISLQSGEQLYRDGRTDADSSRASSARSSSLTPTPPSGRATPSSAFGARERRVKFMSAQR